MLLSVIVKYAVSKDDSIDPFYISGLVKEDTMISACKVRYKGSYCSIEKLQSG